MNVREMSGVELLHAVKAFHPLPWRVNDMYDVVDADGRGVDLLASYGHLAKFVVAAVHAYAAQIETAPDEGA